MFGVRNLVILPDSLKNIDLINFLKLGMVRLYTGSEHRSKSQSLTLTLSVLLTHAQHVVGLHVAVRDASTVKKEKRLGEIPHDVAGLGLGDLTTFILVLSTHTSQMFLSSLFLHHIPAKISLYFLPKSGIVSRRESSLNMD